MVDIAGQYDQNAEPESYNLIPAGIYRASAIDIVREPVSKTNDFGNCLNITWKVEGGQYDGRLIFQKLTLWGKNMNNLDQTTTIAQSMFAGFRGAVGKPIVTDTDELLHIPCNIKVYIKKEKDPQYDDKNEIRSIKPIDGQGQQNGGQQNTQQQQNGNQQQNQNNTQQQNNQQQQSNNQGGGNWPRGN